MANTPVVVLDDTMTSIANAIRSKTGGSATMTPGQMPAQIASIPSGGGVGIPRGVNANGVYGMPTQSFTFSLPSNATDVADYVFNNAFYGCTGLTSADLSSLTAASGISALNSAFNGCTNLTSVDLGSLSTVSEVNAFSDAFSGCTSLTSIDLSSLSVVSGGDAFNNAFYNCTSLTSVDLSSLSTVSGSGAFYNTFHGCTSLTSVDLSSLSVISGDGAFNYTFRGCRGLTSVSFPALTTNSFGSYTDQFRNMLNGVTGCTLHFPAATQTKIGSMSGYPNFGGTNTTVLFDL